MALTEITHGIGRTAIEKVAEGGQRVAESGVGLGDGRAQIFKYLGRVLERFLDVRIHIHITQIGAHGDFQPFHGLVQSRQIVYMTAGCGQAVAGIGFAHHVHHQGRIRYGARHRAGVGEGAKRAGGPVRDFTEGRLVADDTAEAGGDADGAAGIGAESQWGHACGDRGGTAAATPAGGFRRIPGVVGGPAHGAIGNALPAELRGCGLAQRNITMAFQSGYCRRTLVQRGGRIDGSGAFQGRPHGGEEDILDGHRYAIQQPF